ncbi:hypothetical protein AB8Z38_29275 [Bradyrhizobium sp. LLZ17]|uniref:Uncharacterized protein n=1 Tax=Bradyrhizobium sp. LLZ17 TaxID=3239388 RepID=A0AB39XFZ7_9BRAD
MVRDDALKNVGTVVQLRSRGHYFLGVEARDGETFADRGKALFRFGILKAKARALVSSLNPPINLAPLCNAGGFTTKLVQFSAVGSYNQTTSFHHGNTSENQTTMASILF